MPSATPIYGLPYPIDADTARSAVKDTPQALALAIESMVAGLSGVPAPGAWSAVGITGVPAGWTGDLSYKKGLGGVWFFINVNRTNWATGQVLCILPVGTRPSKKWYFEASNLSNGYTVEVETNGVVTMRTGGASGVIGTTFFPI